MPQDPTQTIEITDFSGRLTRRINGEVNSGMAKFNTSWGYDPFSKPGNLTWLEQPVSIAGISDCVLDGKVHMESNLPFVYGIGHTGNFYKIQTNNATTPNLDSVIGIASVKANVSSYNFGASMEFYGANEKVYVSHDTGGK